MGSGADLERLEVLEGAASEIADLIEDKARSLDLDAEELGRLAADTVIDRQMDP